MAIGYWLANSNASLPTTISSAFLWVSLNLWSFSMPSTLNTCLYCCLQAQAYPQESHMLMHSHLAASASVLIWLEARRKLILNFYSTLWTWYNINQSTYWNSVLISSQSISCFDLNLDMTLFKISEVNLL